MFTVGEISPLLREGGIGRLRAFSGIPLSNSYLEFIRTYDYIELRYGDGETLCLFGGDGCIVRTKDYDIHRYLPGVLAIGDDGGSDVYFLGEDDGRFGVYRVGQAVLDMEEAEFIGNSVEEIIEKGISVAL